jgi:hypothetical protein
VNDTIFLHIATIFDNDATPISTKRSAGTDVAIFPYDNVAGNRSLWMDERGLMNYRYKTFE